jgi:aminoglycoside phosphotransferase (APT) family kinase protein
MGKLVGNAHDMGREHKVVSALANTGVPVAPIAGYCTDEGLIGTPFYLMEWVEGPILRSTAEALGFSEADREAIGRRVVETLVGIHAVDPDAVGLGDLGRKENYVARQIKRWTGQWEKGKTRDVPLVEEVGERLAARIPEQGPATIVHGDYRLDNMILTDEGEVAAVVDWELCTLGDPLADVGMLIVYWAKASDQLIPLIDPATKLPGFQSREEVRDLYAELAGRDLSQIDFYIALANWKMAIILEGVYARFTAGQYGKPDEAVEEFGKVVGRLAEAAAEAESRLG